MVDFSAKSAFPKILTSPLTKREIAERASSKAALVMAREMFRVAADRMAGLCSLYFIAPRDHDVCKIGVAENPFGRLRELQTGCWEPLQIKALFWYPSRDIAGIHEFKSLALAKKEGLRLSGEWVDLDHMEAVGLALTAAPPEMVFTDTHGLTFDWFPQVAANERENEFSLTRPLRAANE